ncbi:MAG: hypothetical protein AB7O52_10115 [Planctomycetota bacterium]
MKRRSTGVLAVCMALAGAGCVPFVGAPSATLMTRDLSTDSRELELVGGPVTETETLTWALVFALWGQRPTHESVVARLLEKYDADVLLDAELTSSQFGIPYVFFLFNTTAKGQPARYRDRGAR